MTFLIYSNKDNKLVAAMDTLAKGTNSDGKNINFFLEKHIYFPDSHVLMCGKGVLNIIAILAEELKDVKHENPAELFKYIEKELPDIISLALEKTPAAAGYLTRIYFFYFIKDELYVYKATHKENGDLEYTANPVLINKVYTTNDINIKTDKVAENINSLLYVFDNLKKIYGENSTQSDFSVSALASHFNDPPDSHTGGKLVYYEMSKNTFSHYDIFSFPENIAEEKYSNMKKEAWNAAGFYSLLRRPTNNEDGKEN